MDNVLLITIGVLIGTGLIGAYVRGLRIDTCLHSFEGYMCTMRMKSGKRIWGTLDVETSGLEFKYRKENHDRQGHFETSYVFYKAEFSQIDVIIRYQDELSPEEVLRREKVLRKSFHPGPVRRARRNARNVFNTTKDALGEAINVAASNVRLGKGGQASTITSQQKSMSRTGLDVVESIGNVYDPILEKHVGKTVVLEVTAKDGKPNEFVGILREYSADFIEVLDVNFSELGEEGEKRKADLVVPRLTGFVRHSGEPVSSRSAQSVSIGLAEQRRSAAAAQQAALSTQPPSEVAISGVSNPTPAGPPSNGTTASPSPAGHTRA